MEVGYLIPTVKNYPPLVLTMRLKYICLMNTEQFELNLDAYHESEPVPCPSGQYSFHGGVAHAVPLMIGDVPNQAY